MRLPASSITQLSRRTLAKAVADNLRQRILTAELAVGGRLNQDELASSLGVSRIPLREALRQLEAEGFVEIVPHRGAFVVALSIDEIKEIYEIRIALESLAVELAVPKATPAHLDRIEELLGRMDAEPDPLRWLDLNLEFHNALYLPAARPRLSALIEMWRRHSELYLRIYVMPMGRIRQAQEEHRLILAAYRRRDSVEAVDTLRRHLSHTVEGLTRVLRAASKVDGQRGPKRRSSRGE